jgi:hypothetical protein
MIFVDKLNFTTNYIYFTASNTNFIKTYTQITIFDTFGGMVPLRDLSISERIYGWSATSA